MIKLYAGDMLSMLIFYSRRARNVDQMLVIYLLCAGDLVPTYW